uniref:CSON010155 protein n=1 Tax=Culicoides sonorensis TaxID=179676 RepID=A0A336LP92_CULSO
MHKEENKIIIQTAKKLGLNPSTELISRCSEFLRLLELKSSIISSTSNTARTVICLDIASHVTATQESLDTSGLFKCSGLRKSSYINTKRMIEKALDLNLKVGINEICLKLGISEAKKLATEILNKYQSFCCTTDKINDDFSHPQYAAVAVHCACKKLKVKVQKQKLVNESLLKPQQWMALAKRFEKLLEKDDSSGKANDKTIGKNTTKEQKVQDECAENESKSKKRPLANDTKEEDYEHWKTRILKKAYRELELLEKQEKVSIS